MVRQKFFMSTHLPTTYNAFVINIIDSTRFNPLHAGLRA
jgi:hypothetical protein